RRRPRGGLLRGAARTERLGEETLAARAGEEVVDAAPVRGPERGVPLAQPGQALRLVGKRLLDPGSPVDRASDLLGTARERVGVRLEERRVDASDLGKEGARRVGKRVAREPAAVAGLEAREVLHHVHPRDHAGRALERDTAWCRVEARELGELAV